MEPRRTSGSSADSRSLSVSSDSDALDEPTVLEEARQGSAAANAPRTAKGRSRINSIRSKTFQRPASRSPNHVAPRSNRGVLTSGSRLLGSADAVSEGGLFRRGLSSGRRPTRVSFVDEQDKLAATSSSSESSSRPRIDFTISRQSKEPTEQPAAPQPDMKARIACRALAIANANRNVAAIAAEKQALDDTESPAIDAVEMEIDNLNHQLRDVKDSLHKHCLTILNSLVGDKWTIDTSDTLAKRMLRPSKWSTASQVQKEVHQANEDKQTWFGPSAIDVFGDSLVIEEKNPYRIVGVFARRYQDTRQRIPYLDDLVCSGVLPCIQHLEPPVGRPQLLQAPLEPLSPIKAFPDRGSLPPSKLSRNSADPNDANMGSAERISRRDLPSHSRGSHFRVASMPAPPRAPWGIAKQVMKNRKGACCVAQCPVPCSRYVCVLPPVNYTRSSAPASYATVNIENNNMRIPSRLVDYLDKNCVAVERPSWDKSSTRKHTKVKYTDSRRSRSSTQSDDTDSSWGEDGVDKDGAWGSGTCEIPPMLPTSIASGLPQFFRREVGNRWLPTLFTDADIRISEYWKLENMKNREKAAWVFQGTHAEPKPYPWEEVPLEGRPLSRKEIAQQRKDAKSRRHISRDAERLLRGVAQSTTWDGEASASQRCRSSLTIQHSTRTQWRIRSPAVDHSPVQNGFHRPHSVRDWAFFRLLSIGVETHAGTFHRSSFSAAMRVAAFWEALQPYWNANTSRILEYSSAEAQPSLSVQSPTAPTVHSETLKASRAVQHLGHVVPNCVFGRAAAWGSKNSSVQAIRISRASQKEPFLASVNFARRQHVSTDRFFSTGAVRPISAEHRTEMVTPVQEETV